MSYDVYFEIDTGNGRTVTIEDRNYTSNCSGMWAKALDLPSKPEFNEDGSPRMCSGPVRDDDGNVVKDADGKSVWESRQSHNWGLGLLHNCPASEAAGVLAAAVERMAANPDEYRPMSPENGWGDYASALEFLRWVANTARDHPASTIRISR